MDRVAAHEAASVGITPAVGPNTRAWRIGGASSRDAVSLRVIGSSRPRAKALVFAWIERERHLQRVFAVGVILGADAERVEAEGAIKGDRTLRSIAYLQKNVPHVSLEGEVDEAQYRARVRCPFVAMHGRRDRQVDAARRRRARRTRYAMGAPALARDENARPRAHRFFADVDRRVGAATRENASRSIAITASISSSRIAEISNAAKFTVLWQAGAWIRRR